MGAAVSLLVAAAQPGRWKGAVLFAPLVQFSAAMRPSPIVEFLFRYLVLPLFSTWPTPTAGGSKDVISQITDSPIVMEMILANPLLLRSAAPLATSFALLAMADAVQAKVPSFSLPIFFILGEKDRIIDNAAAQALFQKFPNPDKQIHIYPGVQHAVLADPSKTKQIWISLFAWLAQHVDSPSSSSDSTAPAPPLAAASSVSTSSSSATTASAS